MASNGQQDFDSELLAIKDKYKVCTYFISRLFVFRLFGRLYKVSRYFNFSLISAICVRVCIRMCVYRTPEPMTFPRVGVTKP